MPRQRVRSFLRHRRPRRAAALLAASTAVLALNAVGYAVLISVEPSEVVDQVAQTVITLAVCTWGITVVRTEPSNLGRRNQPGLGPEGASWVTLASFCGVAFGGSVLYQAINGHRPRAWIGELDGYFQTSGQIIVGLLIAMVVELRGRSLTQVARTQRASAAALVAIGGASAMVALAVPADLHVQAACFLITSAGLTSGFVGLLSILYYPHE